MSEMIEEDSLDVIDPLDDLRDDELWAKHEEDGTAKLMLELARKQAQTTLALIDSKTHDIKMFRNDGTIKTLPANNAIYELNKKRRSTVVFLQLVEARQVRLKAQSHANAFNAIYRHRQRAEASDYEPTDFDHALWAILKDRN